ncbi:MAG: hypothetical protein ACOH2V_12640 [Candidatus Saccharimonadaceae bacterium]
MTDKKLAIIFGIISLALLTSLIIKLAEVSEGMNISGLVLGGVIIVGIIIGCLILAGIFMKFVFKNTSFWTILFIMTTVSFVAFHFQLYLL